MYQKTTYENGQTVNDAEVLNKIESALETLFTEINGTVVWYNTAATTAFEAQDIAIDTDRTVKYFEVIYRHGIETTQAEVFSTGKIPAEYTAKLQSVAEHVFWRKATLTQADGATTLNVSACTRRTIANSPASSTQNKFVIPIEVIFYYE